MPQGSKSAYTNKQKRQAHHIEESEKKSGKSAKHSAQIAYATINKSDGGGKKSGSGRKKRVNHVVHQVLLTLVSLTALSFAMPALAEEGESDSGPSPSLSVGVVGAFTGIDSDSSDSVQKQGLSTDRKWGWGLSAGLDSPMGPVSLAIGAMYVRRIFEIGNSTLRIERVVPTLFIPLELRLWLGNAFYVGGGVFGSIRVGDQEDKVLSGSNTVFSFSSNQRDDFEYGFTASAGLTIPIHERTGIALEGKYLYGLKDAAKDSAYEERIRDLALIAGLRFTL